MNGRSRFVTAVLISALAALWTTTATAQQAPKRAITNIAGDVYRFQNNFHFSVFMVTPAGIVATDPIDADAAKWLKDELAKRFGVPVRYLAYSHDHRDHIAGGEVFADTAVVVAHDNARSAIVGEKRPTAVPQVTFDDTLTITLGGKAVELIHVGPSHSDNMVVMRFPEEKVLFVVDIVTVKCVPYRDLSDSYFPGWIEALRKVESLDFDILAPGHGPLGTKADVADNRRYLEELQAAVIAASRQGKSVDEMKQSITMDAYKTWGQYKDWLPLNIEGMARRIDLQRVGN